MKNTKKPFLNHFEDNHLGAAFPRDNPSLLPITRNICPRPQYLLHHILLPPIMATSKGIMKHIIPNQANTILKNPMTK